MNKNSGMLGLTETSNDMREIEQDAARGSERHQLAIEIYCYYIKKYIGAYMAALGGLDAIVFTGGVGENSRLVRRLVTQGLVHLGIAIDLKKNEANERDISAGPVKVLIVPTNEELAIAKDTRHILETTDRTAFAPPPEAAVKRAADFQPQETAKLVLLWARNPGLDPAAMAAKLSQGLGRRVETTAVERELQRLSLVAAPGNLKNPLKK
jgi:acetate kinase